MIIEVSVLASGGLDVDLTDLYRLVGPTGGVVQRLSISWFMNQQD